jgi:Rps23 Pro-64 3,4-dihydroxylase Tpa1-like proline 4-hydroxylase
METIPAFYFDRDRLRSLADRLGPVFRSAQPFQHVVIDDFVPPEIADLLVEEFPGPEDSAWEVHGPGRTAAVGDRNVDKLATSDETRFGPFTRHFMGQLNSGTFIGFLERLSGTFGIIPDVTYNNCGMHSTGRGGRLMMHTDVNRHPLGLKMHQYLNLLLYLNPDWKDEYAGHLELWSHDRKPVHKIAPIKNRVVIFNTGTRSLHGHPVPLACPPGRRRNSLAVYYYLRDRPADETYAGSQRSVRWVPTMEADRTFARDALESGITRLDAAAGQVVGVGVDALPFAVPPELVDAASRTTPLYFLRPADVADRAAFAAVHLRAAIEQDGRGRDGFFAAYRPIAAVGVGSAGAPAKARAVVLLLDQGGEVFAVAGAGSADLLFVGYLDEMLSALGK